MSHRTPGGVSCFASSRRHKADLLLAQERAGAAWFRVPQGRLVRGLRSHRESGCDLRMRKSPVHGEPREVRSPCRASLVFFFNPTTNPFQVAGSPIDRPSRAVRNHKHHEQAHVQARRTALPPSTELARPARLAGGGHRDVRVHGRGAARAASLITFTAGTALRSRTLRDGSRRHRVDRRAGFPVDRDATTVPLLRHLPERLPFVLVGLGSRHHGTSAPWRGRE